MLLIGPPGSGKTHAILQTLESEVRAGRSSEIQLIVPTASMKQHLLFILAKRDLMVPNDLITTITEVVQQRTPNLKIASPVIEDRLLQTAIRKVAPREFGSLTGSKGLRRKIAALMNEFWSAGADNLQVESLARDSHQKAFLAVFREYEEQLAAAEYFHRNQRIAMAAVAIRKNGLGPIKKVLIDGAFRFTVQEEELLKAIEEEAESFQITMIDGLTSYPLDHLQTQILPPRKEAENKTELFEATSPRHEIMEIARQILESNRPYHEHGIILKSPQYYENPLREVFESLNIPFRIQGPRKLSSHGLVRYFLRWLRVIALQFPAEETLELMASPLSPVGNAPSMDKYDFAVRKMLPGKGLETLQTVASENPWYADFEQFLKSLQPLVQKFSQVADANEWAQDCKALSKQLIQLNFPLESRAFQRILDWKVTQRVRTELVRDIEATSCLPDIADLQVPFTTFVDSLEEVLHASNIALPDNRYEVVHVLPIHEARQWNLPVVFVCGLVEGWFPTRATQNIFFDDELRLQLQARGIALRTGLDHTENERYFYRVATTRAYERTVLSHPKYDASGKQLLKSSYLGDESVPKQVPFVCIGDQSSSEIISPDGTVPLIPDARIVDPSESHSLENKTLSEELQQSITAQISDFSPTGLASFLQCPYQYFARKTLNLKGRPDPVKSRMGNREVGSIIHNTLYKWNTERDPKTGSRYEIAKLLNETFDHTLAEQHLEENFRILLMRSNMLTDLERFVRFSENLPINTEYAESGYEEEASFQLKNLDPEATIHSRIDCYLLNSKEECFVIDYKYSSESRIKQLLNDHFGYLGVELQPGEIREKAAGIKRIGQLQLFLYLAALEQQKGYKPVGMMFYGLRTQASLIGRSSKATKLKKGLVVVEPKTFRNEIRDAKHSTALVIQKIRQGSIAVDPRDKKICQEFCEHRNLCRIKWKNAAVVDNQPESCN